MDRPFLPVPINNLKMACGCPIKSVLLYMKDPIFKFLDSLLPTPLEGMSMNTTVSLPLDLLLATCLKSTVETLFSLGLFYQSSALN